MIQLQPDKGAVLPYTLYAAPSVCSACLPGWLVSFAHPPFSGWLVKCRLHAVCSSHCILLCAVQNFLQCLQQQCAVYSVHIAVCTVHITVWRGCSTQSAIWFQLVRPLHPCHCLPQLCNIKTFSWQWNHSSNSTEQIKNILLDFDKAANYMMELKGPLNSCYFVVQFCEIKTIATWPDSDFHGAKYWSIVLLKLQRLMV